MNSYIFNTFKNCCVLDASEIAAKVNPFKIRSLEKIFKSQVQSKKTTVRSSLSRGVGNTVDMWANLK